MGAERKRVLGWAEVRDEAAGLARRWTDHARPAAVYGIPRGGTPVAQLVAEALGVPQVSSPDFGIATLIVDDLVDSGDTMRRYHGRWTDALYRKPHSPAWAAPHATMVHGWVVFPWEVGTDDEAGPTDAVTRLLEFVGEDPTRDGLADTPRRVLSALAEMTDGYRVDPIAMLERTFDGEGYDEMIVLRGIDFTSLCEHHLLPFTGTAMVAYIANGPVVGISKLARLVEVFAHRLQLQERMTAQIADTLDAALHPLGVGVIVRARHACMGCRGVRKAGAEMVTSAMRGAMLTKGEARRELLDLTRD